MATQELGAGLTLPDMVFECSPLDVALAAVAAAVRNGREALLVVVLRGATQLEQLATNLQLTSITQYDARKRFKHLELEYCSNFIKSHKGKNVDLPRIYSVHNLCNKAFTHT